MASLSTDAIYALTAFAWAGMGGICDVRSRRIPNRLTGSGVVAGLLLHACFGGWRSAAAAAASGVIAGSVFLVFYLAGGMGAGDVKLITAVCCLAGLSAVAGILLATAVLGGVFAITLALFRRRLKDTLSNVGHLLVYHGTRGFRPHPELNVSNPQTLRLPYGVAIAAGAASSLCGVLLR